MSYLIGILFILTHGNSILNSKHVTINNTNNIEVFKIRFVQSQSEAVSSAWAEVLSAGNSADYMYVCMSLPSIA